MAMKILYWNCRVLGSPRAVQVLRAFIAQYNPQLVFLIETKISKNKRIHSRINIHYDGLVLVDACGSHGGLALMWNNSCNLVIKSYSGHHITASVHDFEINKPWTFIGFYGEQHQREEQWRFWRLLKYLINQSHQNVMIWGDFNEILSSI